MNTGQICVLLQVSSVDQSYTSILYDVFCLVKRIGGVNGDRDSSNKDTGHIAHSPLIAVG